MQIAASRLDFEKAEQLKQNLSKYKNIKQSRLLLTPDLVRILMCLVSKYIKWAHMSTT